MAGNIEEGLRDLNFLHVAFEIRFGRAAQYTDHGYDTVEFRISKNPVEQLRNLEKVVYVVELYIIIIAIKTIL